MCRDIICRAYSRCLLILSKSGFNYPESDFRGKILSHKASEEDFGDHTK